ncbi:hypothetical protein WR25_26450 [Diploscapter pachys]|uniref:Uncharacterized protein n=1 Tax=Diploscapter pachys TaxID=2018661 RepID=A0A2A2KCZ9_9BILA|nr:hypothetical protein WR25_26450 [Diploscapter pachys]
MSNSTPKKRKSNTNIDAIAGGVQRGPKMERYKLDELEKQMEGESSQQQAVNRRGSIIGAVGSLLKKIKSTSTLKNPESARHSFASTGSSSVFAFPDPDALDKDDGGSEFSFESGSSTGSIDPELLERCEKNKLLRRVLNGEERAMSSVYSQPGTQVSGVSLESYSSITTGSAVGLEMEEKEEWEPGKMLPPPLPRSTPGTPHRISMAAFCTPKRPSSRYSMKSAPGAILDGQGNGTGQNESDSGSLVDNGTSLIRGLCNSVRRTHSSMSDIRLHRKPSSARRRKHLVSMADLPEEEQENHDSDKKKSTEVPKMPGGVTTPISPLGRRQSIWSKLGSGSGKRRNSLDAVSPMLMEQVSFSTSTSVALDQEKITPSSALSAARGIGSSGRKKSSSSFSRFLQGFRKGSTCEKF